MGGQLIPKGGLCLIVGQSVAIPVVGSKFLHALHMTLPGSLHPPMVGFLVVLLNALAEIIRVGKVDLRLHVALIGSLEIPMARKRVALFHAVAIVITFGHVVAGIGVAELGRL